MASLFIGINRGQTAKDVVTGSATATKDIEIRVDDTKGLLKSEIIQKVQDLLDVFLTKSTQFK